MIFVLFLTTFSIKVLKVIMFIINAVKLTKRNQWPDEECRAASAMKNDAYKRTLQSAATRTIVEDYSQKRREERLLIRRNKRKRERREREEIEMFRSRNDAQKFFKSFNRLKKGFKPGASSCRGLSGDRCARDAKVLEVSLLYVIAKQ